MVSESHRRKKAAIMRIRTKKVTVVLLKRIPPSIPRGLHRNKLKKDGRILDLAFHRSMTSKEAMQLIVDAFKELGGVKKLQFLQGNRDNTIKMYDQQELDGNGVLNLAGCGSLYVKQVEESDMAPNEESEARACSSSDICQDQLSSDDVRRKYLLKRADEVIKDLRVSELCHTCTLMNRVPYLMAVYGLLMHLYLH